MQIFIIFGDLFLLCLFIVIARNSARSVPTIKYLCLSAIYDFCDYLVTVNVRKTVTPFHTQMGS
tara:strand:- start:358 stop:549 length:192 start_codon:yes stop_codon:yes gene_type:complete